MLFYAMPFPATDAPPPEAVAQALRSLGGPLCDKHNTRYAPAPPLDRSRYSACPTCGTSFGLFRRKNNCGNCGLVVCSDCLGSRWYLPKYGLAAPVACCPMCNRNLAISLMGKDELQKRAVRELRGYLTVYGLYSPSMIEKSDLVAAVFANSPMPQANEQHYRDCLPRPSSSSARSSSRHPRPQDVASNSSNVPSGSDLWGTMLAQISTGIDHGLESIAQHLGGNIGQHLDDRLASGNGVPGHIKTLTRDGTDPSTLSIKTLKAVLAANHVDYSNLIEKQELVKRVALLIDNTKLEMASVDAPSSDDPARFEENICKICWDAATNCVFLNCGHMCTCLDCGNKIVDSARRECPICREHIAKVVHVFRA